jgi:Trypsin-like peptidase domain
LTHFEIPLRFGDDQKVVLTDGQVFPQPSPLQRMVLPVVVYNDVHVRRVGSGALLAPGLVLTARHILSDELPAIMAGKLVPAVLFISDQKVPGQEERPWFVVLKVTNIGQSQETPPSQADFLGPDTRSDRGHDLALLTTEVPFIGDEPASSLEAPLSFRAPATGTKVLALGYPGLPDEVELQDGPMVLGHLVAAQGTINQIHAPYRDRASIPFPVLESDYPDSIGMSGGPVFTEHGNVCAVICRGEEVASYASLLPPALNLTVTMDDEMHTLYELIERSVVRSDGSHRLYRPSS